MVVIWFIICLSIGSYTCVLAIAILLAHSLHSVILPQYPDLNDPSIDPTMTLIMTSLPLYYDVTTPLLWRNYPSTMTLLPRRLTIYGIFNVFGVARVPAQTANTMPMSMSASMALYTPVFFNSTIRIFFLRNNLIYLFIIFFAGGGGIAFFKHSESSLDWFYDVTALSSPIPLTICHSDFMTSLPSALRFLS